MARVGVAGRKIHDNVPVVRKVARMERLVQSKIASEGDKGMIAKVCLLLALSALSAPCAAETAESIVRKAVAQYGHNQEVLSNYTYHMLTVGRDLDGKGQVRSTHSDLTEVLYIGGRRHERLLEKDGKPLSEKEAKKEQESLDRAARDAEKLTPEERQARDREGKKQRERESMSHIPDACDMRIVGEPEVNGRPAWQIHLSPRRDYNGPDSAVLRHIEADLWIDKGDYAWVRIDADALDTISFGFFLARIAKGTRISMERTRVNDEVWALHTLKMKASARVALVKSFNAEADVTFSEYRRFRTDARMVDPE